MFRRKNSPDVRNNDLRRVITFGTFDLLHEGHIKLLERARAHGDYLIVGVSTDALNAIKGKSAMFSQEQRVAYVKALEFVDETFLEDSLEKKDEYIKEYAADVLVMGDDWKGQFDWVSCEVQYLPRTENVSSSQLKHEMLKSSTMRKVLFGDTYVQKHYDCAMSMLGEMLEANIAPILTQSKSLPRNLSIDCIVYFNKPAEDPPAEYKDVPRVCIDHGASNLKWFLASKERFEFFDRIITAGPDHSKSILTFYPESEHHTRVHSAGFIKSPDLLSPPKLSREEAARAARVDPSKPIILFVPTWYIARNRDMQKSVDEISTISNHVTILHPETRYIDVSALNVMENSAGSVTEMMKHADCIISDLSSTIFEAAPLGKPVIQILMREYSDNGATLYQFPTVAGTADPFCGGMFCRPGQITETVERILNDPKSLQSFFEACQKRILQGTKMNDVVAEKITSELLIASSEKRSEAENQDLDNIRERGFKQVESNLAHSRLSLIAHGGGDYNSNHASNSREAIRAALTSIGLAEVDLVKGKDAIFLAHNGFEERYGFEKPFEEVTAEEFSQAKYNGKLTTLNLDEFFDMFKKIGGRVIFDIKNMDEEYDEISATVYQRIKDAGLEDRIIMQAYCKRDFETVNRLGFRRSILAVWKYYYLSPLGEDAYKFISDCMAINDTKVWGISIPYYNHHMPAPSIDMDEILPYYSFWKRIFIHGAPQDRYPDILRMNMGVFADAFKKGIQFKDVSGKFAWRRYLFLNAELIQNGIDNQVSATCHFHQWGQNEGRLDKYNVPKDFKWASYLDKNEDLKISGVCSQDGAKAHWTKYGSKESRRY